MGDRPHAVPKSLARTVTELHGERGKRWLDSLPDLIASCEARWRLTVLDAFAPLTYNYVAPTVREDGSEAVLKVGVPCDELRTEMEALRLFDGHGAVRLLEADADRGVMLLERVRPGASLWDATEDVAVGAAVSVMRRLPRPAPEGHPFPTTGRWGLGFRRLRRAFGGSGRGTGPFPPSLVDRAERLFMELEATAGGAVVLHGDLHHGNILAGTREPWLAIDPKGVVGETAYEVGAFVRNPTPDLFDRPEVERVLKWRLDRFADELGHDRQRLWGWSLAQAVLSAWWSYEDHGAGWEPAIECARLLERIERG